MGLSRHEYLHRLTASPSSTLSYTANLPTPRPLVGENKTLARPHRNTYNHMGPILVQTASVFFYSYRVSIKGYDYHYIKLGFSEHP